MEGKVKVKVAALGEFNFLSRQVEAQYFIVSPDTTLKSTWESAGRSGTEIRSCAAAEGARRVKWYEHRQDNNAHETARYQCVCTLC